MGLSAWVSGGFNNGSWGGKIFRHQRALFKHGISIMVDKLPMLGMRAVLEQFEKKRQRWSSGKHRQRATCAFWLCNLISKVEMQAERL